MRAIQQREFGGPEVLELVDLPVPEPGDGEVLIRVSRAGMSCRSCPAARSPACARTPASASSR
jgi:D-arabinose 1-dehydrogenase-like Zn-dependent alcohol dehydrogenase